MVSTIDSSAECWSRNHSRGCYRSRTLQSGERLAGGILSLQFRANCPLRNGTYLLVFNKESLETLESTAEPLLERIAVPRVPRARHKLRARHLLVYAQVSALVLDLGSVILAFWLAYLLRYDLELGGTILLPDREPFSTFLRPMLTCVVMVAIVFPMRGMYRQRRDFGLLDSIPKVIGGITMAMAASVMLAFFLRFAPSRLVFLYAWIIAIVLMSTHRLIFRYIQRQLWHNGVGVDRVLVVGDAPSGRRLLQAILGQPGLGYQLVGCVGSYTNDAYVSVATEQGVLAVPQLGAVDDIPRLVGEYEVDEIILLQTGVTDRVALEILDHCRELVVRFRIVPDVLQYSLDRVDLAELGGLPTIAVKDASIRGWNAFMKRGMDIAVSLAVLIVAAIPMLLIGWWIRRDSEGPILFRQTRIGKGGKTFTLLKFRCMVDGAEERWEEMVEATDGADDRLFKLKDDPRLTNVGRHIRRYSLDELPQFIQILKGEMSVIGPRPSLPREVDLYDDWHRQRLLVKPGLTGLWQVNGRSSLTFDEMVRLDLYYAENWSPWLDTKIMLRTIPAVVQGKGAY